MASFIWPVTLPQLPDIGLQETAPDLVLRTEMDAGPAKVRRRFTAGVREFRTTVSPLTAAQVQTLDDFFVNDLTGVLPFDWQIPRSGATVEMRFVEPPRYDAIDPTFYRASLSLEVLP